MISSAYLCNFDNTNVNGITVFILDAKVLSTSQLFDCVDIGIRL